MKFFFILSLLFIRMASAADSRAIKNHEDRKSKYTRDTSEMMADRRELKLSVGEDKIIDLDYSLESDEKGNKFIAISNPDIVATNVVTIDGASNQLVFIPQKEGDTTVTVRDRTGNIKNIFRVEVASNNLENLAGQLRKLLRDIEGIEISVEGPNVAIDGELFTMDDYGRVLSVITAKPYSDVVLFLAKISPASLQAIAARIEMDLKTFAPNVSTRVSNGMIFIEGNVASIEDYKMAELRANTFLPEAKPANFLAKVDPTALVDTKRKFIQNYLKVEPAPPKRTDPMIRMVFNFVELSKDYSRAFGFKWVPGFTADPSLTIGQKPSDGTTGSTASSFTATLSNLFPKIQSTQEAGFARILKKSTITTRNGIEASFNENIQIPVITTDAQGRQVVNTTAVGFKVKVVPYSLEEGKQVQLNVSVNHRAPVGQSGGNPLVSERDLSTSVYTKNEQSAVLGGFEGSEVYTAFNKQPNSGNFAAASSATAATTQPLFNMTRSKGYQKSNNKVIVVVTPTITNDSSDLPEGLEKTFRKFN